MKKSLFAVLVAVFAVASAVDLSAATGRCKIKCDKEEIYEACPPAPKCMKQISEVVCAPAKKECYKVCSWKCPSGYETVSAEAAE